jgi:putative serine protease PepD
VKVFAVIIAAVLAGAAVGAATFAILDTNSSTTVVRQVTVKQSLEAASRSTRALTVNSIYKLANRGVVKITVTYPADSPNARSQGSGFVYDTAGHVVTNQHVIDGADAITVTFWNGRDYPARLVGSDPSTDTAVINVDAPSSILHPVAVADSGTVQVGDGVVAIGSPFGLAETVTAGIVSALHRKMTSPNNFTIEDSIQTDTAINHGNSGGPLLNMQGKVIGITTQIQSDSGGNEGVGFAVPSETVRTIAGKLIATGKAEHAFLGVSLPPEQNAAARLTEIRPGTPAEAAGLQAGDVITSFAGTKISSADALSHLVDTKAPGDVVTVTFTRDGKSHTVKVTLASRPSQPS